MKARGHNIPLDAPTSLVARSARNGEIVRVDNVREAEDWLPNPLLPDTYAEMAVPIILEGQVVGVLDVQQNKIASLDEGDANLLRSLVNQVAIALHNARLFDQVEKALAEAYAAQERYVEQSWDKTKITAQGGQYLYVDTNVAFPDGAKQESMVKVQEQILHQASAQVLTNNDDKAASHALAAPVRIGNTLIGSLQLHRSDPNQAWDENELAVVEAVTEQLAQTAENLRLFEETRSRAGQEKIIREITERMRASTSLAELVKVTAQELGNHLLAEHTIVEVGIEAEQMEVGDRMKRLIHAHQNGS
jgi:putative methionine-R-sulfoxide reductase with GAF domain